MKFPDAQGIQLFSRSLRCRRMESNRFRVFYVILSKDYTLASGIYIRGHPLTPFLPAVCRSGDSRAERSTGIFHQ